MNLHSYIHMYIQMYVSVTGCLSAYVGIFVCTYIHIFSSEIRFVKFGCSFCFTCGNSVYDLIKILFLLIYTGFFLLARYYFLLLLQTVLLKLNVNCSKIILTFLFLNEFKLFGNIFNTISLFRFLFYCFQWYLKYILSFEKNSKQMFVCMSYTLNYNATDQLF